MCKIVVIIVLIVKYIHCTDESQCVKKDDNGARY